MEKYILEVLLPFVFFLHVFDEEKGHNMLVLMFDPRFKNMHLVTMFLGRENANVAVVEYDEKLLLPLLMMANKLLMFDRVKRLVIFTRKWILKVYFIATITNTYMDIVSRELVGFQWFPIDVESCKCVLCWWQK
jgi:hypothetical protein